MQQSKLSDRVQSIAPSPTLALTAKAKELKAAGKDVISLGAGEPDFDTPQWIKEEAKKQIDAGFTKYTPAAGIPELRQAIKTKFEKDNSLFFDLDQITVANGGKQIIFNALMATINPGDEVVILAPYWVSYPDMVKLCGGVPKIVECREENDFKVDPKDLMRAISSRTKWVILNSPSNPTGALYSNRELEVIADSLMQYTHFYVMSDEVYEHLVYDNESFFNISQVSSFLKDRTLIVNAISKAYSMTGWRIGYGAGPKDLIAAMNKINSQSTSCCSSISQKAAVAALNGDHGFLKEWKAEFQKRRDMAVSILNDTPGLSVKTPKGAFYLYVNCEGALGKRTPNGKQINSDNEFCQYLLEDALVASVSGDAFGLSPYFRISYALDAKELEKACHRIKSAMESLQ